MYAKLAQLLKSTIFRYILTLGLGILVGAFIMPSQKTEEKISAKYESQIATLKSEHEKERKTFQEQLDVRSEKEKTTIKEYEHKVATLTVQISELKSKTKTSYYKLVKPDGTIEVRKFNETEINESSQVVTQINQEFKEKVASIEKQWEETHRQRVTAIQKEYSLKLAEYEKTISDLKASKTVESNKKRFSAEGGALTNGNYYGHFGMDLIGPVQVGVLGELGPHPALGIGLGVRF